MIQQTMSALERLKFDYILPHMSYCPDLTPCDFFLFINPKEYSNGRLYASGDVVQAASWVRENTSGFFRGDYGDK